MTISYGREHCEPNRLSTMNYRLSICKPPHIQSPLLEARSLTVTWLLFVMVGVTVNRTDYCLTISIRNSLRSLVKRVLPWWFFFGDGQVWLDLIWWIFHYLEDACNLGCRFTKLTKVPWRTVLTEMVVHAAPSHERQLRTHMPTKPVRCNWGLHPHLCHQTLRSTAILR